MKKIFKTALWIRLFIWVFCLVPFPVLLIFVTIHSIRSGKYSELILLPFGLIIIPLLWVVFRILRGNKLTLTETGIEYYENNSLTTIPYSTITKINMGMSRKYYDRSGMTQTPVIHYENDGNNREFGLPHWMSRKKIFKALSAHVNQEIISQEVKEKYL